MSEKWWESEPVVASETDRGEDNWWADHPIVADSGKANSKDVQPEKAPSTLANIGQFGVDFGSRILGSVASGTASIPLGAEKALKGLVRGAVTGGAGSAMPAGVYNPSLDTDETVFGPETSKETAFRELSAERAASGIPNIPGARGLADLGGKAREKIHATASKETQDAIKGSEITGNIFKGEIDFGKDPSVRGYVMQAADVFGSMLPVVGAALVAGPGAGAVVGGGMAAGEGVDSARDFLAGKTDTELMEQSPFFARMVEGGATPKEARQLTLDRSSETAALLQGMVAGAGDKFTGKLVTGQLDALLTKAAGKSIAGRTAAGTALSGGEQGAQEVVEGVGADLGIASVVPTKEVGEDSAANLVLGALGGGPMGGARGAGSGISERLAERAAAKKERGLAVDVTYQNAAGETVTSTGSSPAESVAQSVEQSPAQSVATSDTTAAEAALRAPVALTALDRANEVAGESAGLQERLNELTEANGFGPAFDGERQEVAAQIAELEQERADIAATWPSAIKGKPTQFATEGGAKLDGEYALMESDDLVTSHTEGLQANPLYPAELQPRDRSRNASEVQISGIVQKLDPARLGLSADAATGAPIVGADGLVESGNARTIALKRVYQANGQKATDYKAWLEQTADQFGVTPEQIQGMNKPVLVRVRSTPVNRAEFARQANASTVQRMSPSEQALSDAKRLVSLDGLNPDDNGDFSTSYDFIRQFRSTLPLTEQGEMMESDGRLSTAGYRRIQNAVLARAYGDSPSLRRMTESMDNNMVNVSKALLRVAPTIAAARERMDAGTLHNADIAPDLLAAVEGLSSLKEKGWTPAQELAQTDLTGPKYTPEAVELLNFLNDNARSPRRIAEFFQRYYEALEQSGDPSQPNMFGDEPAPARADLINKAKGSSDGNTSQDPQRGINREGAQTDARNEGQPQDAPGDGGSTQGDASAPGSTSGQPQAQPRRQAAEPVTSGPESVGEWVSFDKDSGTLGIPRADMPQVRGEHRGALVGFLKARGIESTRETVPADSLKATQAEYSRSKVDKFAKSGLAGNRSVLVSSDGHVLDGHHQWMGLKANGAEIDTIRLDAPIRELLAAVAEFPSVQQSDGATKADTAKLDREAAVQDFKDALGDLAQIATKHTRANMLPEDTPGLMPALVKLFDASIRLLGNDVRVTTTWVKNQMKKDPRLKTLWNRIKPETYRKAALQALEAMDTPAQQGLFESVDAAESAIQADLFSQAAPAPTAKPAAEPAAAANLPSHGKELARETVKLEPTKRQDTSPYGRHATGEYIITIEDAGNGPSAHLYAVMRSNGVQSAARAPAAMLEHSAFDKLNARAIKLYEATVASQAQDALFSRPANDAPGAGTLILGDDAPTNDDTRLSRGDEPGQGVPVQQLEGLVDRLRKQLPNMPKVHILEGPAKAPKALREYIVDQGATLDAEGAMHNGELYVFASGLADLARAEHVIAEHEAAHFGLRALLGADGVARAMRQIWRTNKDVRAAVAQLRKRGNLSELAAVEEVIVDIPTAQLAKLKGWRKVVQAVRDHLAKRGYDGLAKRLGDWLDGSMSEQHRADMFVGDLVRAARDYVAGKGPGGPGGRRGSGAQTLLSRERDQTRTAAFKKWFGDSKVVDADGKPLVVYHGTKSNIKKFDLNRIESDDAFFFTTSPEHAGVYADGEGANIMPVFLSIQKPYEINVRDWNSGDEQMTPEDILMSGYDGFIIRGQEGGDTYAAFKPSQIKSATGNNGNFDGANPDIRFSRTPATASAYEARIDALFGGASADRQGIRVLDRSDVLGLLGHPDQPVVLAEGKVRQGQDNHPRMTAAMWKSVPEWLESPAAVFSSDTVPGRLVFIAPEMLNGSPVRMIVEPDTKVGGLQVHLLLNAFDADGRTPWMRWASDGLAKYIDKKKFPAILAPSGLQLSRVEQASRGTAKILIEKQLAGYRKAKADTKLSFAGSRAATADLSAMTSAQDRLAAGEDAEKVRRDTGWHEGADGRWRFEIADNEAKVDAGLLGNLRRGGFKARAIEHVTYRKNEDGTYQLLLVPAEPQKTEDLVSLNNVPAKLLPSLLPSEALEAIEEGKGEDDLIGQDMEDAKKVDTPFEFEGFEALPLELVLDHPKLFAAYPALRDIMVKGNPKLGNGATYAVTDYVDGTVGKVIQLGNAGAADVDSVLLHEIQHGIQDIEGFASGGSMESAHDILADEKSIAFSKAQGAWYESRLRWPSSYKALMAVRNLDGQLHEKYGINTLDADGRPVKDVVLAGELREKISEADKAKRSQAQSAYSNAVELELGGFGSDEFKGFYGLYRDVIKAYEGSAESPMSIYRRLAGEVEARNTQARQKLPDMARKYSSPESTADVPRSDVVVVYNGKEMASAPAPANAAPQRAPTVSVAELSAMAAAIQSKNPNLPKVNALADPSSAPEKLRDYIEEQGAALDVEGAMHDGELYLFASGLADMARAEHVLIEHEAAHFGLRALLGEEGVARAMRQIWNTNKDVRAAVAQLRKLGGLSELAATEEVIVDIPTAQLAKLKGWRKVVRAVRDHLAKRGYEGLAKRLGDWLDGSMSEQQRADLFVGDLVRAARAYVAGEGEAGATVAGVRQDSGTSLSRAAPNDPASAPPPQGPWQTIKSRVDTLVSAERVDKFLYEFQDKLIDLKRLRAHIEEIGGTINDLNDAYQGEELYHKRVAKRTGDFLSEELKPLLAQMRAKAISLAQFEEFLHARHAPEANRELSFRNPNIAMIDAGVTAADAQIRDLELALQKAQKSGAAVEPINKALDAAMAERKRWSGVQAFRGTEAERLSLSGMSDADAAAVMARLDESGRANMDALAGKVDAINQATMDTLKSYGLMDAATLELWKKTYKHYVPLHRDEAHADSSSHPIGQGFSVKGDAGKRRAGSNQKVTHILGHIAMQREAALTRGEKNMVAQKLYLMAAQNPDAEWWSVDRPPRRAYVDAKTGFAAEGVDPMYKNRPNVVMVRIGGKDAAVVFNERNERALRLAESLKNLDASDMHVVLGLAAKATRWFAAVNTQYNPVFGVINFTRDAQAALLGLGSTPLRGMEARVAKNMLPALRAIYADQRAIRKGGKPGEAGGEWSKLWQEMQLTGGTTGYRDLYADPQDRAKALEKVMGELDRGHASKFAHGMLNWLSDYNETMEGSTRLAAYKVALESGMTRHQAASLAKNLTVNFNRKGRQTREIGALYAFFNAAVQGSARMMDVLRGPTGKKVMAGGVLLGAMNAMIGMAMMGGDDDDDESGWSKIPEFVRERSIVIPLGREDYVAIPLPLGFNVLPNLGRKAVEAMAGLGGKSTGSQLADMLGMAINAFNPFGAPSEASLTQLAMMLSPTVTDPGISLLANTDWTGKPIYRKDSNSMSPTPGHLRTKDSASTPSKLVSKWLNSLSGGTEYRPGVVSWTPDQIDYVIGQLTGGVGRELMKTNQMLAAPFTGDELPSYKIPLLGRMYGNLRGTNVESGSFYENVRELNEIENEIKGRARDGKDAAGYRDSEPLAALIGRGNGAEKQMRQLRKVRDRATAEGDTARVKELNERMAGVMKDLNRSVNRVRREAEAAR